MTYHIPGDEILEHIESPGEDLTLVEAQVDKAGDLWIRAEPTDNGEGPDAGER